MRDVNKRDSRLLLNVFQLVLHILAQFQIQRRQRLVQKQHARIVDQRTGNCHTLLLSARKGRHRTLFKAFQIHHCEHRLHALDDLFFLDLLHPQTERHIFKNIQMRKKRVFLKHGIHRSLVRWNILDILSVKNHASLIRRQKSADDTQCGRFPAPGRTEEGHKLLVVNRKIDSLQHLLTVKFDGHAFEHDNCFTFQFCIPHNSKLHKIKNSARIPDKTI